MAARFSLKQKEFIKHNAELMTFEELSQATGLHYKALHSYCRKKKLTPKGTNWNKTYHSPQKKQSPHPRRSACFV